MWQTVAALDGEGMYVGRPRRSHLTLRLRDTKNNVHLLSALQTIPHTKGRTTWAISKSEHEGAQNVFSVFDILLHLQKLQNTSCPSWYNRWKASGSMSLMCFQERDSKCVYYHIYWKREKGLKRNEPLKSLPLNKNNHLFKRLFNRNFYNDRCAGYVSGTTMSHMWLFSIKM